MIAMALAVSIAALSFDEQRIRDFFVERGHTLNALPSGPFLKMDFDGDGHIDLLLPNAVAFQRGGRFPDDARREIPGLDERPFADAWNGDLFLFFPDRVVRLRWEDEEWTPILEQSLSWPEAFADAVRDPEFPAAFDSARGAPRVRIRRLLHDFAGNGDPAIVAAAPTGLWAMQWKDGEFLAPRFLEIFPPLRLARPPRLSLWPPSERRVAFPVRQMACRYFIDGKAITTVERTDSSAQTARYIVSRFTVDTAEGGALELAKQGVHTTPPVSHSLRPWRLNQENGIDFAGGELSQTRASLIPAPLYTTLASTDEGETIQEIRSVSFRPTVSFVDFNQNGDLDLVAHHTGLFEGGAREVVARAVSDRQVRHRISVHLQHEGTFPRSPTLEGTFAITLDHPPSRYSPMFQRYQAADLFDLGGDIDGSGRNDAVVQAQPHRLHVYRSMENRFERHPAAEIPIAADEGFLVMDVNGNGRADIVIQPLVRPGDEPARPARVLFSRETP